MNHLILGLCAILAPSLALASGPGERPMGGNGVEYLTAGTMTYELFETAIAHVDVEACPAEFDPEAVFCCMTLANDAAHVFVFAIAGDQPLLAVKSYPLDDGFLPF